MQFSKDDFEKELASLRSQFVILEKKGAHSKYLPLAIELQVLENKAAEL